MNRICILTIAVLFGSGGAVRAQDSTFGGSLGSAAMQFLENHGLPGSSTTSPFTNGISNGLGQTVSQWTQQGIHGQELADRVHWLQRMRSDEIADRTRWMEERRYEFGRRDFRDREFRDERFRDRDRDRGRDDRFRDRDRIRDDRSHERDARGTRDHDFGRDRDPRHDRGEDRAARDHNPRSDRDEHHRDNLARRDHNFQGGRDHGMQHNLADRNGFAGHTGVKGGRNENHPAAHAMSQGAHSQHLPSTMSAHHASSPAPRGSAHPVHVGRHK